jgi:hypothetical protein
MTAQKQHPIRNNVIGSLATAAIVAFVVYLIPGGWAWVIEKGGKAIRVIATWLGSSVSVPAWMVLIMSLLALAAIIAVAIVAYAVVRKSDDQIEPFTEAEFLMSSGAGSMANLESTTSQPFAPTATFRFIRRVLRCIAL